MLVALIILVVLSILAVVVIYLSFRYPHWAPKPQFIPAIEHFPHDTKCDSRVVVSFSTIPARMPFVPDVIKRLKVQIYQPDVIYACIPYTCKRTGERYVVPDEWNFGPQVVIARGEDYGPATKLLGCIAHESDPDTIIITIDDDHFYAPEVVLKRVVYCMAYPNACVSDKGLTATRTDVSCVSNMCSISPYVQYLEGFGCVAYRRRFVTEDMIKYYKNRLTYDCLLSDDLTLSTWMRMSNAMLIRTCANERTDIPKVDVIQPLHRQQRPIVYRNCARELEELQYIRKYIWPKSYYYLANKFEPYRPNVYDLIFDRARFSLIRHGDVVCISTQFLRRFLRDIFDSLSVPIILITTDRDDEVDESYRSFADDERLGHWFAQNCSLVHPKVSQLPIGLDLHTAMHFKNDHPYHQEKELDEIRKSLKPLSARKPKAYANFHYNYTHPERRDAQRQLENNSSVYFAPGRTTPQEFWRALDDYAFVVSPRGKGLDCHRTWEALIMGCIVLVKTSPLDPLYKDLPVIILQDWDQITRANLTRWKTKACAATYDYSKLFTAYWKDQIEEQRRRIKNQAGSNTLRSAHAIS